MQYCIGCKTNVKTCSDNIFQLLHKTNIRAFCKAIASDKHTGIQLKYLKICISTKLTLKSWCIYNLRRNYIMYALDICALFVQESY